MEFQTIISNYNAKSSIEPEIFLIFQHKVERVPHFARVSEVRHIILFMICKKTKTQTKNVLQWHVFLNFFSLRCQKFFVSTKVS